MEYWASVQLPLEVEKSSSLLMTAITDVFDRFLGSVRPLSVLEIGGAPASTRRTFTDRIRSRDHDLREAARRWAARRLAENFRLLKMNVEVVSGWTC